MIRNEMREMLHAMLFVLLLSLNLPAAWKEAEFLWDQKKGRICQIFEGDLREVFDANADQADQRDELFDAVDAAIKQKKDLGEVFIEFFGEEEISPEEKKKAIKEAWDQGKDWYLKVWFLNKKFDEVRQYIAHKHLLSAFNQYNNDFLPNLLSCIERMREKIKEDADDSEEVNKEQMSFTFKKNQNGHLCVISFLDQRAEINGELFRVQEICAVKVLEPSFASYIEHLPGYCFKRLAEQEERDFYTSQSLLNLRLPEVGCPDDDVRLSIIHGKKLQLQLFTKEREMKSTID